MPLDTPHPADDIRAALPDLAPLRRFVTTLTQAVSDRALAQHEAALLARVRPALAELVAQDGWLPEALARPHPQYYQQYLLHADPLGRFSVVSFVWGPGQRTPIHDHTVWGAIGVLRGEELAQAYRVQDASDPDSPLVPDGPPQRLRTGATELVSPTLGDVHEVRNAFDDRVSISIHVYGANIGSVRRWVYPPGEPASARKSFVSGYSNTWVPNLLAGN